MASPGGEISNRLFETLEEWNTHLNYHAPTGTGPALHKSLAWLFDGPRVSSAHVLLDLSRVLSFYDLPEFRDGAKRSESAIL